MGSRVSGSEAEASDVDLAVAVTPIQSQITSNAHQVVKRLSSLVPMSKNLYKILSTAKTTENAANSHEYQLGMLDIRCLRLVCEPIFGRVLQV